jgi:hypothetical protein
MTAKFSITQLEKARKSPFDFAKALKNGTSTSSGFGYPKSLRWLNAIFKFHQGDINQAILSLEKGFSQRKDTPKNRREVENFIEAISSYEINIKKKGLLFVKSREAITIEINSSLKITGIIPLIYMNPSNGFSAYFISKENEHWQTELKFPVVQNYIANEVFNCEISDVQIGYIDYYSGLFHDTIFTDKEIKSALKEVTAIGKLIMSNL